MQEYEHASDEAQQVADPAPLTPLVMQPSTWTSLWALAALGYLMFARKSFSRLG